MNKKMNLSEYLNFARFKLGAKYIQDTAEISSGTLQGLINGNEPSQDRIIRNLEQFRKDHPLDE